MKIIQTILLSLTAISFMACGNNSSSSIAVEETSNETSSETTFEKIAIDVNCTSPDTVSEYITLKSGD